MVGDPIPATRKEEDKKSSRFPEGEFDLVVLLHRLSEEEGPDGGGKEKNKPSVTTTMDSFFFCVATSAFLNATPVQSSPKRRCRGGDDVCLIGMVV